MALHPPGVLWISAFVGDGGGGGSPWCFSPAGAADFHGQEGPNEQATGPGSRWSAASPIVNSAWWTSKLTIN